ncbi:hypothetical protein [Streptomyces lavendofoliae]|uniref:Uncharacterized protein n=1 Tax=Streptomyces lavendofoliae TaxID=67314 RepID=A0A918I4R8_9ACTN|nr:hypothetical protein [Streptomyces lavendofoliae]GGU62248.1 hypothetical protein GCM10010274_58780 [Streptomyces lavendofoliae]
MVSYRVEWTQDGRRRTSVVSYDEPSAKGRKADLEAAGAVDVVIVRVKPGE